jgi:hypothetical protein
MIALRPSFLEIAGLKETGFQGTSRDDNGTTTGETNGMKWPAQAAVAALFTAPPAEMQKDACMQVRRKSRRP